MNFALWSTKTNKQNFRFPNNTFPKNYRVWILLATKYIEDLCREIVEVADIILLLLKSSLPFCNSLHVTLA